MPTNISWTDETWNPVVGCDHVSEGCRNCYAEKMSNRLQSMDHADQYDDVVDDQGRFAGGEVNTAPSQLKKPLRWDKPRRIFTCSMSDLFHPDVPFEYIDRVFAVMAVASNHTFQVLTKRPERMKEYLSRGDSLITPWRNEAELITGKDYPECMFVTPLSNVWLGTSVENQDAADERIPALLQCPAEVRFLSCEPLLGPVNLTDVVGENGVGRDSLRIQPESHSGLGESPEDSIDWVIAGGESGPNARPMHPNWVRSLRDQCQEADVPFFFKQWGAMFKVRKGKSRRELYGRTWEQFPKANDAEDYS